MGSAASAIALNHSRSAGSTKLVLLGIAEHEGEGGSWPSINRLARYASITPRNVSKALVRLEQLGEIRRNVQEGGTHEYSAWDRPNRYDFLLKCPVTCDRTSGHNPVEKGAPLWEVLPPAQKRDERPAAASSGNPVWNTEHPLYDPDKDPREVERAARASLAAAQGVSEATGGEGVSEATPPQVSEATPKESPLTTYKTSPESHVGERARESALTAWQASQEVPATRGEPVPWNLVYRDECTPGHYGHRHAIRFGACADCGAVPVPRPRPEQSA